MYWISELNISHGSTFDDTSTKHQHYGEISSFNTRTIAGGTSCTLFYFSSCRYWRIPVFVPGNNPRLSRFSWIIIGPCWIEWKVCRRTVKSLWMIKNNKCSYNPTILSYSNKWQLNLLPWPIVSVSLKDIVVLGACFVVASLSPRCSIPFDNKIFKRLINMTFATRQNYIWIWSK